MSRTVDKGDTKKSDYKAEMGDKEENEDKAEGGGR